jgi:hypothetical protein
VNCFRIPKITYIFLKQAGERAIKESSYKYLRCEAFSAEPNGDQRAACCMVICLEVQVLYIQTSEATEPREGEWSC